MTSALTLEQIVTDMRAGLEGVTPGDWGHRPDGMRSHDWEVFPERDGPPPFGVWAALACCPDQYSEKRQNPDEAECNSAHIARCSPDNIAAILNALTEANSEIESLKQGYEIVAHERDAITARATKAEAERDAAVGIINEMAPHIHQIKSAAQINDEFGRVVVGQTEAAKTLAVILARVLGEQP